MRQDLVTLELDKVLSNVASFATSAMAKAMLKTLQPVFTFDQASEQMKETTAAWLALQRLGALSLDGLTDIRPIAKRLLAGGVLSGVDFRAIAMHYLNVKTAISYHNRYLQLLDPSPALSLYFHQCRYQESIHSLLMHTVDEEGIFLDTASLELASIRKSMRQLQSKIQASIQQALSQYSKHITDSIITRRNDRFVIPVKAESKHMVKGIVQDVSSSGETVFIEPMAVVELENTYREWIRKEADEIERICLSISEQLVPFSEEMRTNVTVLIDLDVLFAKASYGLSLNAVPIHFQSSIRLLQARHPLLDPSTVVANDFYFDHVQAILITGPNTGGKTVALKTMGLLSLMAQSGLLLPVKEGSQCRVFDGIYADIGDEQSIEQSLSTFSSHMSNMIRIMKLATQDSLVLLDELGSGTDPKEGAMLAIALVDYFLAKGSHLIATTHYSELKGYASVNDLIVNASTEFDVVALAPTYKLHIGLPGASNAIAIARRLGMDETVLANASAGFSNDEALVASLTEELKQRKAQYEDLIQQVVVDQQRVADDQAIIADKLAALETQRLHFEQDKQRRIQAAIDELKAYTDEVVNELKAKADVRHHEVIEAKAKIQAMQPRQEPVTSKVLQYKTGEDVFVSTYNQSAVVEKVLSQQQYQIRMGILSLTVHASELKKIDQVDKPKKSSIKYVAKAISPQCDIRGERFEDAMLQVEKYLDDCLTSTLKQVSIIHGFGTHALRQGVQELLAKTSGIERFHYGEPAEGGQGVTIVHFK
jgi:DNA mismatch repair protein MutS2